MCANLPHDEPCDKPVSQFSVRAMIQRRAATRGRFFKASSLRKRANGWTSVGKARHGRGTRRGLRER